MEESLKELRNKWDYKTKTDLITFARRCFKALYPGESFAVNWYVELMAEFANTVYGGDLKRLVVNLPPRHLKSFFWSIVVPAWMLAQNPTKKIIVVSYSKFISENSSMMCRQILQQPWFQRIFPETAIMRGANTKRKFLTTKNGFYLATSVNGSLTGEGADILIADDPQNPISAHSLKMRDKLSVWYDHTFLSRLNDRRFGKIIVVSQRLHSDDLSARLLARGGYTHLSIPLEQIEDKEYRINGKSWFRQAGTTTCSERYNPEVMAEMKHEFGNHAYAAQYLQAPIPEAGNLFKSEYLVDYDSSQQDEYNTIVQSWDVSASRGQNADYSVGITVGIKDETVHILDIKREKLEYGELKKLVFEQQQKHHAEFVLIENKSSGIALIQELQAARMAVVPVTPTQDKITRAYSVLSMLEAKQVHIDKTRGYYREFVEEYSAFPSAKHDDQVDALTQVLDWIREDRANTPSVRWL